MKFFVGLHKPSHAAQFLAQPVMISANALSRRVSDFTAGEWMLDSGAFTTVTSHGGYPDPPGVYAEQVRRWSRCGRLLAAVSQDYMCEVFVLARTGLTVAEHQRLTIERYDALLPLVGDTYLLPVLQGYWPDEYLSHLGRYGDRLAPGSWVGVGSVCKRNRDVEATEAVLWAIHDARPDLLLHGFGLKTTALESSVVRQCLHSADSMAWSFAARRQARPHLKNLTVEFGRKVKPTEMRRVMKGRGVDVPDPNDSELGREMADKITSQRVKRRHFQMRLC